MKRTCSLPLAAALMSMSYSANNDGSGSARTYSADGLGGGVTSGKLDGGKVLSANNGIGTGAIKPSDVVDRNAKLDANSGYVTDTGIKGHDASGIAKKNNGITGDAHLGTGHGSA